MIIPTFGYCAWMALLIAVHAWRAYLIFFGVLVAPILICGRLRARWRWWETLTLVLPYLIWIVTVISTFLADIGANRWRWGGDTFLFCQLLGINLAIALGALVRVILARRVNQDLCARRVILSLCAFSVSLYWLVR